MLFVILLMVGLVWAVTDRNTSQPVKVGWIIAMCFFAVLGLLVVGA